MDRGARGASGCVRLVGLLRQLRPEILHGHMFHANILARVARLACPIPVLVSTLHSAEESRSGSVDVRWRDRCYRLTDRLADATVAVAQAVAARHLSAKAASPARMRVIPNGVDTERYRPRRDLRDQVRRTLGLDRQFAWLAVGRLIWKKGFRNLLEAFGFLESGVLLIAGEGPEREDLHRLARGDVRFLGQRDDVADLMAACDGFVQSSFVEGFPVALLEAASCGLPCVATDAGGCAEAGVARIVPPGDPVALAGAMRGVMEMPPAVREGLGLENRARVAARFDAGLVAGLWEALYRELLARWT
jgi:glycosyltransferase involved in cell wall biosynthesis